MKTLPTLALLAVIPLVPAGASHAAPVFDWTPNGAPSGSWIPSWKNETGNSRIYAAGPDGSTIQVFAVSAAGASPVWSPYYSDAVAHDEFSLAAYCSLDNLKSDASKTAVLWCMGHRTRGARTMLLLDTDRRLKLVHAPYGTKVESAQKLSLLPCIDAGEVPPGWHLLTIGFSAEKGAYLRIDGGEPAIDRDFTAKPGPGFQVGTVLGGIDDAEIFARAEGFAVLRAIAYAECDFPGYAALCGELGLAAPEGGDAVLEEPEYEPSPEEIADTCVLRISEIMPKPTDDMDPGEREGMDVNGLESGWVEVENISDKWADLADYRFIRVNRGKKTDPAGAGNFPHFYVKPRSLAVFYTSERYSNSKDRSVSAFAEGPFDGVPRTMDAKYGGILVWGDKVNPKKFPYVRLYYAPGGNIEKTVDTVVVPCDIPEGYSIIVGEAAEGEGVRRWLCPAPTRGRKNTPVEGLARLGPNVGPLYEKPGQAKTGVASEFDMPVPPAKPGEDYTVSLAVNPVMNPDGTFEPREADRIKSVKLVYRTDMDDSTTAEIDVDMASRTSDPALGDVYTCAIPASALPGAGRLVQWKALITDGEGVEWTSPSFNNKDDGYEWYGTIVEPDGTQTSATLPTWHLFADAASLVQMDIDASKQNLSVVPNHARVAIYDSSTSNYYDHVRIDLRGNTSAKFTKKGHGLRFAKAHPLAMRDAVTGEELDGIRKTSLISEFADPSLMRQMIAFWLWRKMGNLVPFDFPVRCNLNGEFYQLAFNSERFTDELIEDVYGLDKFGYGYKNAGTFKSGSGTTAGGIEKKTPDDEDESNITVLQNALRAKITAAQNISGVSAAALSSEETDRTGLDNPALTKFVVEKFDLPAWLNYLASARITQEMDDVWANVCAYLDDPEMKEGTRGTGTWMPLGYDFNVSFGQYYHDSGVDIKTLMADQDWFKSHPFYGGNRVRCHGSAALTSTINQGNDGFEAVWQSAKFRRLYLRRLRTLMDGELKAPGTPEEEVPFMAKMREMAGLMRADAALDRKKWPNDSSDDAIDSWRSSTRPADIDAGIDDIWENYVVPRREHLYVAHSATNTARKIGYGTNLGAGIPEAQSPVSVLAPHISISNMTVLDAAEAEAMGVGRLFFDKEQLVIHNGSGEAVDMSGWTVRHSVDFTMPPGTVCDANDDIYIVADRRAWIAAHESELTDQVVVGNAKFAGTGPIAIFAADGEEVLSVVPLTDEARYLRLHSFCGNTAGGGDEGEWFTLTNISDSATLDLAGVAVCFLKQGDDESAAHCHVTLENKKGKGGVKPLSSWTARQADYAGKGWDKIQNNKLRITVSDRYGAVCQTLLVTQKNFLWAYGLGGHLVCESAAASVDSDGAWRQEYGLANGFESLSFAAKSQAAADEAVRAVVVSPSADDEAAGLPGEALRVVAAPDGAGGWKAVVDLNPETVPAPSVEAVGGAGAAPDSGGGAFAATVGNAVRGVWYGYEAADAPGGSFAPDRESFVRAPAGGKVRIEATPSGKPSGFFRVKAAASRP